MLSPDLENDIVQIVLQYFIENPESEINADSLVQEFGYNKIKIVKSLSLLSECGLVTKTSIREGNKNLFFYQLNTEIKAINIIQATQLGIDISHFDANFNIKKEEKQLALSLSTKIEKIKEFEEKDKKPLVFKNFSTIGNIDSSDLIAINLAYIFEAVNLSLYEYIEKLSKKDKVLSNLLKIHEQAESSLKDHITKR